MKTNLLSAFRSIFWYLMLALFCVSAFAQTKIDFSQVVHDLDGQPIASPNPKIATGLTLGEAIHNALVAALPKDGSLTPDQKYSLYELAKKVKEKGATFTIDEIKTMHDRVGEAYSQVVQGPIWDMLAKATGTSPTPSK
jgi:hypothetical protein